jgi:hypothetical protein
MYCRSGIMKAPRAVRQQHIVMSSVRFGTKNHSPAPMYWTGLDWTVSPTVARQRLGKHIRGKEVLLNSSFFIRTVSYQRKVNDYFLTNFLDNKCLSGAKCCPSLLEALGIHVPSCIHNSTVFCCISNHCPTASCVSVANAVCKYTRTFRNADININNLNVLLPVSY